MKALIRFVAASIAAIGSGFLWAAPAANWASFKSTTSAEETTHTLTQGEWTLTIPGTLDTETGAITLTGAATLTGTGDGTGAFSLMAELAGTPNAEGRVFAFTATDNNVGWLKFTGTTLNLGHSAGTNYSTTSAWDGTRAKLTLVHGSSDGTNIYKDGASILGENGLRWSGRVYKSFTIGLAGMKLYGVSLYTERLTSADAVSAAGALMHRAAGCMALALDETGKPLRSNYTGNISTGTAGRGQVSVTQNSWVNYTNGGNAGVSNGAGLTATDASGAFYNLLLSTGAFSGLGESSTWVENSTTFAAANDTNMTFNGASNAASLNIQSGRWLVGSAGGFANVATIFLTGGQLWLDSNSASKTGTQTRFVLGASNYSETNAYGGAALRADGTATLSTVEVIENAKITQAGSTTLTLSTLSGSKDLTFATYSGTPNLTIGNAAGYTGTLSKPSGIVTLNSGTTFGGELQQAAGTLTLAGTGGHTVKKVAASGSALTIALGSNAESIRENIEVLSLGSATVTVTQTSWNNFISVGSPDGTGTLSGTGTLKWNQTTNHYTPSTLTITGDNTGFVGAIETVRASGGTESRPYQHYLVAASNTALGSANLYLNGANAQNYSSLAVNADTVTVGTLRGTAYAYVLSGLTEPAVNSGCALRTGDGTDRTLKLIGAQNGTWLGTIGPHLNIEVAGSGTWEVGDGCLGSGTVTLTSGTLVLPVQSAAQTITPNAEGCTGTLVLRLSDEQLGSPTLTTNVRWSGNLSQVKVWDSMGVEQTQFSASLAEDTGDLVLTNASAIWSPTNANHTWSDTSLWSGQTVPTEGLVTIDCSALTAAINLEIPAEAQLTKVVVTGFESAAAAQLLTLSLAEGATIGTLELLGYSRVQLPCTAAITTRSVGSDAILTLDMGAATAEAPATLPTFTGTGTVSLTNGYATTEPFADFTGTLDLDASATLRVSNGAAVKSCRAITGSGTLRFQGVVPNVTGSAVDGLPGISNSAAWTGTITVSGITGSNTQLRPNAYGNANSTVEFDGVAGWMNALTVPRLRLTGEGLTLSNGSSTSNANIVVNTLVGTGKFQGATDGSSRAWMYSLLIGSAADFEGSFELTPANASNDQLVIQIGSTTAPSSTTDFLKNISIVNGATVSVKKPWVPASGGKIRVLSGATLEVATGTPESITETTARSFTDNATIENAGTLKLTSGYAYINVTGAGETVVPASSRFIFGIGGDNYTAPFTNSLTVEATGELQLRTFYAATLVVPTLTLNGKVTQDQSATPTLKVTGTGTLASGSTLGAGAALTVAERATCTLAGPTIDYHATALLTVDGELSVTETTTAYRQVVGAGKISVAEGKTLTLGRDSDTGKTGLVAGEDGFAGTLEVTNTATLALPNYASTPYTVENCDVTVNGTLSGGATLTLSAGKSLSGSGTINVPVAFANEVSATMASDASLTFGSTLSVPENVTLSGTVNLASTAVISGKGKVTGEVTFAEGAQLDVSQGVLGVSSVTGTVTVTGHTAAVQPVLYTAQSDVSFAAISGYTLPWKQGYYWLVKDTAKVLSAVAPASESATAWSALPWKSSDGLEVSSNIFMLGLDLTADVSAAADGAYVALDMSSAYCSTIDLTLSGENLMVFYEGTEEAVANFKSLTVEGVAAVEIAALNHLTSSSVAVSGTLYPLDVADTVTPLTKSITGTGVVGVLSNSAVTIASTLGSATNDLATFQGSLLVGRGATLTLTSPIKQEMSGDIAIADGTSRLVIGNGSQTSGLVLKGRFLTGQTASTFGGTLAISKNSYFTFASSSVATVTGAVVAGTSGTGRLTLGDGTTASTLTLAGTLGTVADGVATYAGAIEVAANSELRLMPTLATTLSASVTGAGKVVIGDGTAATQVSQAAAGCDISAIDIAAGATYTVGTAGTQSVMLPATTTVTVAEGGKLVVDTARQMNANVTGAGEVEVKAASKYVFAADQTNRLAPGKLTLKSGLVLHAARDNETGLSVNELTLKSATLSMELAESVTTKPVVTVAANQVLSGEGAIEMPIVFEAGAIFDAKNSVAGGSLSLAGVDITWPESGTVTVRATEPVQLMVFAAGSSEHFTLETSATALELYLSEATGFFGTDVTMSVLKKLGTDTLPAAVSENDAVKTAIQEELDAWAGKGYIITKVTDITTQSTVGEVKGSVQAVDCFTNLETTLVLTPDWDGGFSTTATAVVTYDFGVSDITIKEAQLAGDAAAQLYVLTCAKVSNGKAEDASAAGYAEGTTVTLWLNDADSGATLLDADTLSAQFGITAGTGERWFALPMSGLGLGTHGFTVRASKTTSTP
ncbi:MAG: beta strand repeat-containing protein [Candidatus Spyradenecus sp.]